MPVTIELPEDLSRYADGQTLIAVAGQNVGEVLAALFALHPDLPSRLIGRRGELFPYLPLFLNGQKLSNQNYSPIAVADGDRLEVIVLASGG